MQVKSLVVGSDGDVIGLGLGSGKEGGDVGGEGLQRVRGFGVVVGQEQVAYAIVEGVVQGSLTLEGISFAQCAVLEQQLYDFVVPT